VDDHDPALEDRFILFFDFLGASDAAKKWPHDRVHEFVDLLISIAHLRSAQELSGSPLAEGSYRVTVTPEVTTFSDNVVTYPGVPQEEGVEVRSHEGVSAVGRSPPAPTIPRPCCRQ
jgi:hypothetical protein